MPLSKHLEPFDCAQGTLSNDSTLAERSRTFIWFLLSLTALGLYLKISLIKPNQLNQTPLYILLIRNRL